MSSDRIRTPWNIRLRRFQHRLLPLICFMFTLGVTVLLWQFHGSMPELSGTVEAVRVDVATAEDGMLLPSIGRMPMLFDEVKSGQILMQLDPTVATAELDALRGDLAEIRAKLSAERVELVLDRLERDRDHRREAIRLIVKVEDLRLDLLDRTTELEADKVEQMRLASNLQFISEAYRQEITTEMEYDNARLLHEQASKRVAESEKAKQGAATTLADAERRLDALVEPVEPELETLLAPLRSEIEAGEARVRAVEARIERLAIRAPISGTICAITAWPGQAVAANQPVMTIAANEGRYVVGYVRTYQRIEPHVGATVRVRRNMGPATWSESTIDRVSPQIEPIPEYLLRDPKTPEWGLAVRIPIPNTLRARPGERIDIVYDGDHHVEGTVEQGNSLPADRSSPTLTPQGG